MRKNILLRRTIQLLPVAGLILLILLVIYGRLHGVFDSPKTLQLFIKAFGKAAVWLFIFLQILQPIVPILPGGILAVVGMLMFGNFSGLLYSYIGLVIGEVLLFFLIRYYGRGFARMILSDKNYQKFDTILADRTKDVRKLLIGAFILPFMPDDILCLAAGLTSMRFREYLLIILLLKPWSVATYGFLVIFLLNKTQVFY